MQNAYCHIGSLLSEELSLKKVSPKDAESHLLIEDAVDWCIGDGMQPLQCLVGVVGHAGGITEKKKKENVIIISFRFSHKC